MAISFTSKGVITVKYQSLRIDVLSRMSYSLKISYGGTEYRVRDYVNGQIVVQEPHCPIDMKDVRPLLRRMSSMTDREKIEYETLLANAAADGEVWKVTDWLNRRMFDYRGLIDKNMAVEM